MLNYKLEKESKESLNSKQKVFIYLTKIIFINYNLQAEEYAKIIETYATEQNNLEIAQKYNERRLCHKFFIFLRKGIKTTKVLFFLKFSYFCFQLIEQFKKNRENKRILYKVYHGFLYWRKLSFIKKIMDFKNKRKNHLLTKRTFFNWRNNLSFLENYKQFQIKKNDKLLTYCFSAIKKYLGLRGSKENAKVVFFKNF